MLKSIVVDSRMYLCVAVACCVSVAGCGGGGSVGSTPPPAPTPTPSPTPTPTPPPSPTPSPTPSSAFLTSEYNRSTGPSQHGAITAWSQGYNGTGVTIGIIDSGIDTTSPEFAGRISTASRDVVGTRPLTNPDSDHGTNVAMVAAAARDNTGIMGIAFSAQIAMFRADSTGSCATADPNVPDSGCKFFDSAITTGVNEAVAAGAKVINLSLGGSPPNAQLSAAIANAAAHDVVVLVSAGNDGDSTDPAVDPNNPDPFAAGLRAAGNGNVIIAGSVDKNNVLSTFSNRAGTEATWYLTARGERVCCVYENGQMKIVTNPDGTQSVYVFSGTSFSAPQIAGAAALLRQAFPNLTAVQVVDLLLRTASDGGAVGTDAVYGRGILNIAAAFAPQGTTRLAGSTTAVPLGDTSMVTSAPMGDAAKGSKGFNAIVLDSYRRAYQYNLGNEVRTAQQPSRLAGALALEARHVSLGNDKLALSFSIEAKDRIAKLSWQGTLRLSMKDAELARVLAARVVSQIAPNSKVAFGFAQGADGLSAQLAGLDQPAFLVARSPADDLGFAREDMLSAAWRTQFGHWGLTASTDRGSAVSAAPLWESSTGINGFHYAPVYRYGLALDRTFGRARLALGASWLNERDTVLGARFNSLFSGRGADSLFVDVAGQWQPSGGWRLGAQWRGGFTYPRQAGLFAGGDRLRTSAWSAEISRLGLLSRSDALRLRLAQPLRVETGGVTFNLPVSYSYQSLEPTFGAVSLPLSPHGREIDGELMWRGPLWNGVALLSLFYRRDPGHFESAADDQGLAIGWTKNF